MSLHKAIKLTGGYFALWFVVLLAAAMRDSLSPWILWPVLSLSIPVGAAWLWWTRYPEPKPAITVSLVATLVYILWWQFSIHLTDALFLDTARATIARWGTVGLFLVGLGWVVWLVERASNHYKSLRLDELPKGDVVSAYAQKPEKETGETKTIWNPLDVDAWYYGRDQNKKLNQSLISLFSYTFTFFLIMVILTNLRGCREIYELPAGGGEQQTIAQTVKVQKIIRKKYVVNPYSAIVFNERIIDDIKLQLTEITKHAYKIGQGAGSGAGFGGGTPRGKVRFIRLEYAGGDWDQDFGVGGDLNMLFEYGIRTQHKVEKRTESRRVADLRNFPVGKSPPLVYLTGQKSISLSNNETKILREYLLDKHGMIFGDNGGSRHFHNQFVSMMNRVLPDIRPVPIPLDDHIHRVPFAIPFLPYVAPHGGSEALGWYKDGRWVAYYHPGDIGDAWSDGHAGVKPEVWEACYQLGTNVIFYAHAEYSKWLDSQNKE